MVFLATELCIFVTNNQKVLLRSFLLLAYLKSEKMHELPIITANFTKLRHRIGILLLVRSKPGKNCPFFLSRFSQWIHVPQTTLFEKHSRATPTLEPKMKLIRSPIAEIWQFEISKMAAGRHIRFSWIWRSTKSFFYFL